MSVKTQIFLAKTFAGLCWIGAGVSGYFDSVFTDVLQIIFLARVVIALIVLVKAKREIYDEMFLENYQHAQAKTEDVMHGVFCIATVLTPFLKLVPSSASWDWPLIMAWTFFVILGIQNLITGILFWKYEEA